MLHKFNIDKTPIYFQESSSLPILDIVLNFRCGSAFDGDLNGLADLAVGLFATKTKSSSEQELINKITDIGASINAATAKEFFNIKIRILNEQEIIEKTLKILKEIFTQQIFSEDILAREKSQTITHINYLQQQPRYIASLEFSKNLFVDNPYSKATIGYKDTVERITTKDIASFYNKYICADNANICIVGCTDETDMQNIAKEILAILPKGQKNTQLFSQKKATTNIIKQHFPSKQTSILIGHQLLYSIDDPLYFPLKLGNEILGGGGLNSLLFNEVRENLGLVYHIDSNASLDLNHGSFIISAQTSQPKLALKTIKEVYSNFISNPIDEQTLANSKEHIKGTHLLGSVKNSSKINMLASIANKNLPLDFFDKYVDNINAVTAQQIVNAYQKVQENELITVMVGDV